VNYFPSAIVKLHVMQLKVAKLDIETLQKVEKNSLNAFLSINKIS